LILNTSELDFTGDVTLSPNSSPDLAISMFACSICIDVTSWVDSLPVLSAILIESPIFRPPLSSLITATPILS